MTLILVLIAFALGLALGLLLMAYAMHKVAYDREVPAWQKRLATLPYIFTRD